jgi:2-haloacid dehalogenase
MPSPISTLVFDLGGVLIDWNPRYLYRKLFPDDPAAMERFLEEIRFDEWNLAMDAGRDFSAILADLTHRFPQYAQELQSYQQRWEETLGGPISETVSLLPQLRQNGYHLLAISNWSAETFSIARRKYSFLDLFDFILISGDVKVLKPDPRIYQIFLQKTGKKAQECMIIDDKKINTDTAQTLGFHVLWLEAPDQLEEALRRQGILD